MIKFRPILLTIGALLCALAAAMLIPAAVDASMGNANWLVFFTSALITFFFGGMLVLTNWSDDRFRFGIREGFLLTTTSWLTLSLFASIPFIGLGLSVADAVFEAMSGLTTTVATVLTKLESLPRGILLWRALLQAIGGIGVIVMALVVLPFLRVGGMQLFQTESSERSEKVLPRAAEIVTATVGIYLALMLACMTLFLIFGMTPFDAVCHAMSTVSTGGFSTHDESFGFFPSAALHWTAIGFMLVGGLPFVLLIQALRGQPLALWRDAQVRGFLALLMLVTLIMTLWLLANREIEFEEALRLSAFNVVSIGTTAGFATSDYTAWGPFAVGVFFVLMFIGGCSGSTTGGIKIYRLQVAGIMTRSHLLHLMSPNRIVSLAYNNRRLPDDVPFSVIAFLAIYLATIGLFTVILAAMGLDLVTSLSSALAAVSNVGPGLGPIVGPASTFAGLPDAAKIVLAVAMLLGRLELFTVLVVLRPEFWRS